MIKAASDSQQPTPQTPPSFPTYNPAQNSKSMMKNAPLSPISESTTNLSTENKPTNMVSGGIVTPTTPNSTTTQPVIPAKPKFPDPTTKTYIKADGTKTDKSGSNNGENNNNSKKKQKKKSNWKMALGVIVLLFIVLGTGTGFYLTQQSQDLRQQADEIDWTCPAVESCPDSEGLLVNCTPPEADGTSNNSLCNTSEIGRIEPCGGSEYCCDGTNWTSDMTACTTAISVDCNDLAAVEDCDASTSPDCAWFYCVESCFSADTTLEEAGCDEECAQVYCENGTPPGQLCNTDCTADTQCSNTDINWSCDTTTNTCRLTNNSSSEICEETIIIDSVSCDNITGTLTNGTVEDETTELTYEVTSSGEELVAGVDFVIHGNFEGPGWTPDIWVALESDTTPTDNVFSSSTTYNEMIDLLVATGHDRQQLIDEGIVYYANVIGPDGFCHANGTLTGTGETCDFNDLCTGTIILSSSVEAASDNNDDSGDDENNDSSDDNTDTTVGCNDICVTNSDCQDTDHICVTTADGSNRCRLTTYTSSESCVIESSGDTTTDTTTQPSLPAELPESGPEDWLNWLKAGLVTMGIGTALFLLL